VAIECLETAVKISFVAGGLRGHPFLDVKTYRPQYRTEEFSLAAWFRKLADEKGYV
jgi:hypothetical protein